MSEILAGLFFPLVIGIGSTIAFLSLILGVARNYKKCPPNAVMVVYGRKHKMRVADGLGDIKQAEVGYRLVIGGATFVMPMLENYEVLHLGTFQVPTRVADTPNIDGVPVDVEAIANVKISSDPTLLGAAVERLLSMQQQQLEAIASSTLEAQLRQIVGTLTIEKMIKDRESIQQTVLAVTQGELNKLGLALDNFGIIKIFDKNGYIEALGKSRTAQVKRDAAVAEAEARREEDIKTAAARLAGETAKAEAEKQISDAQRTKDMAVADNLTEVKRRQARIEIAAQAEAQEAQAELNQKTVAAQMAKTQADTELQTLMLKRNEAELEATTVTSARKEKEARVIRAQAEQEAASREGEAARIKAEKEGQGVQARLTAEAEGRKAAAAALKSEKEAEAAGQQAMLLAEAAGKRADGEAEGAAKLAIYMAEAEGLDRKNRALADLSEGARTIMVLEKLPGIIEEAGVAGEKVVGSAFEHVGRGFSQIDEVRIVDFGGHNGGSPVENFALNIPRVVSKTLAQFEEQGINLERALAMIGIDKAGLEKILGGVSKAPPRAKTDGVTGSSELAVAARE